ncbi:MAG TPA: protein kinase, partial [Polyangiaceae bacterium]|nr:protein kinase [Polyangiaceae bacterium]
MALDIGTTVDRRYLLKREIARGGAGAVFEAEHIYTKRSVALKLLVPEQRSAAEPRARLLREALALSAARHPGVVAALDAGETDDGTPYLVLELLEGRSLEGILAVRRRISSAEAAQVGAAICDALSAAHRRGIIHRDIKPSNVFVARDEQGREVVKLFDFGVARVPSESNKLTQDGALLGTPEYMAPEQLLARDVDGRTDLYALGVTLYECLAGVVPFEGNFGEVLLSVSTKMLPPLREKAADVPPDLASAIEKALAREPDERFADAATFAQALRAAGPAATPGSLLGIRQGPPAIPRPATVSAPSPRAKGGPASPVIPASHGAASQGAPVSHGVPASPARVVPVPPPLPATRRRFPRAPYVTPVRIYYGSSVLDGRSEDVSVGGLLVLAPQAFEQAEQVKVRFALPMTG